MTGTGDGGKLAGPGPCFMSAAQIAALPGKTTIHPFNPDAVRHTRSLGDIWPT